MKNMAKSLLCGVVLFGQAVAFGSNIEESCSEDYVKDLSIEESSGDIEVLGVKHCRYMYGTDAVSYIRVPNLNVTKSFFVGTQRVIGGTYQPMEWRSALYLTDENGNEWWDRKFTVKYLYSEGGYDTFALRQRFVGYPERSFVRVVQGDETQTITYSYM